MEVLEEQPGRQVLQSGSHQGDTNNGNRLSATGMMQPSLLKAHRDRKTRDSGFEDTDASTATGLVSNSNNNASRLPLNAASPSGRMTAPMSTYQHQVRSSRAAEQALDLRIGSQGQSIDAEQVRPAEQGSQCQQDHGGQHAQSNTHRPQSPADMRMAAQGEASPRHSTDLHHGPQRSATATAILDPAQRQLQQHYEIHLHPHDTQRRSSTPMIFHAVPSQTLVSKIDREKSTVCFQSVPPIEVVATKSNTTATANRQPSFAPKSQQSQIPHGSPYVTTLNNLPILGTGSSGEFHLGANAPRRDSSGSQGTTSTTISNTNTNTTTATGISSISGASFYNTKNNSSVVDGSKSMISYSHGLALQHQANLVVDTKTTQPRRFSAGVSPKIHTLAQAQAQQQPQQQQQPPQPIVSNHRSSPSRQSTASYFSMPSPAAQLQHHNQQLKQFQQQQASPLPTPPLNTPNTRPVPLAAPSPYLSPAATVLSNGRVGSPIVDPSTWAIQQQQQQLQQQIELQLQQQYQQNQHLQLQLQLDQLQHLQMQQHQILMQQQQIDKTRAALMASTSAIVTHQQQQQQLLMMPMMYPTATVTAAVGAGGLASPTVGLASNPVGVAHVVT